MAETFESSSPKLLVEKAEVGICEDYPVTEERWLVGGKAAGAEDSARTGPAPALSQASQASMWRFYGASDQSNAPRTCVVLGLHP